MRLNMKWVIFNVALVIITCILLVKIISPRINTFITLNKLDYNSENILKQINSDIIYEEKVEDELKIYSIHEHDSIKHMTYESSATEEKYELYEFDNRVFKYNRDTKEYVEYNFEDEKSNDENFKDVLDSLDYVYNFCNELTFKNYIKTVQNNESTKIGMNKYRVDIEQNSMFNGSKSVEFYTDYFGRIISGIYYRDPVGKWSKFKIGAEVNKIKLPNILKNIKENRG